MTFGLEKFKTKPRPAEAGQKCKPNTSRPRKDFVIVPVGEDWGYRAMPIAGRGAAIVLYALYRQRAHSLTEVPITAAVLKRYGISRKTRTLTIKRLVRARLARVRYRGKYRGCPLLTLLLPSDT